MEESTRPVGVSEMEVTFPPKLEDSESRGSEIGISLLNQIETYFRRIYN
jgi:hypothetical protein